MTNKPSIKKWRAAILCAGPSGKFRYEALGLKYCLVKFHDSTQRHTNLPQRAERLEYYDRVH